MSPRLRAAEKAWHAQAGLHLSVRALGITEDDEVLTTPFSFVASANCLLYERAVPCFVDIEEDSLGLDPDLVASVTAARRIERETRAAAQLLAGRGAVRDGRPAEAAMRFRHGMRCSGPGTRLKALAALACLHTPLDVETMFDLGGEAARRWCGGRDRMGSP